MSLRRKYKTPRHSSLTTFTTVTPLTPSRKDKSASNNDVARAFVFSRKIYLPCFRLTAQTESLDYCTVAFDVALVQIIEEAAALTNEDGQ